MKIIKRNGSEVAFDITKIIVAITKANEDVDEADRMTPVQIRRIAESVELQCQNEPCRHRGGNSGHGGAPHHGPWGL